MADLPEYLPKTKAEYYRFFDRLYDTGGQFANVHVYTEFQRIATRGAKSPILNAASGSDPYGLAEFGAVNLDLHDRSEFSGGMEAAAKNFVKGSVLDIPFPDKHFATVVLGEFLEHCKPDVALRALLECKRVLCDDGVIIVTVPLDARPEEEQVWYGRMMTPDAPTHDQEYDDGITGRHQTYWSLIPLERLLFDAGLEDSKPRALLVYFFTTPVVGWGMHLKKRDLK